MTSKKRYLCEECGAEISEGTNFCYNCGAELAWNEDEEFECSSCGKEIEEDSKYCKNCGSKLIWSSLEKKAEINIKKGINRNIKTYDVEKVIKHGTWLSICLCLFTAPLGIIIGLMTMSNVGKINDTNNFKKTKESQLFIKSLLEKIRWNCSFLAWSTPIIGLINLSRYPQQYTPNATKFLSVTNIIICTIGVLTAMYFKSIANESLKSIEGGI